MRSNPEFAEICGDYAQIVADIAGQEGTLSHGKAVLGDLLRLKADLEKDIVEWLSMIEESPAASREDSPT